MSTAAEAKRAHMVEKQLRRRNIRDERVLGAMSSIPREAFVPHSARGSAYADEPISIGHGQTISQPYMTALMAQTLELNGSETVLEVGAGSGYAAAVLSQLAAKVIAVEIIPELAEQARANLKAAGYDRNVQLICADGSLGHPDLAPYDAISVAAAAPDVPGQLIDQLTDPGRLVIPVGSLDEQELWVKTKSGGRVTSRMAARCRFVPLRGGRGWQLV
ncbi:MAG: protein-L-isoaspartate(D-aspartate) O-methyltransferase [bacterium]|nr:protein-L-isoaspartate(D-aspartate) O-methyltransferase [bacterium]